MINYIFGFFFIIGITYSFIKNINISEVMLAASNTSIELIFSIIPVICLWMGIMNIARKSGLMDKMARFLTCTNLEL